MAEDVAEPETRPAELERNEKPDLTLQRKSDDLSQQKDGESADRKQREADKLPASLPRWPFLLVGLVVAIFVAVVLYIIFRPRPDVRTADAYVMAKEALSAGHEDKAFAIMRAEINRQRSGRGRFRRTMQLIELVVTSGKDAIAQPLLDDVTAMIENHKLDAWEEPEQVASDLLMLMRNSKKIQGSSSDKQKMFERICRLDPVQALSVG